MAKLKGTIIGEPLSGSDGEKDRLVGRRGDATLTGGTGKDKFVINTKRDEGDDAITDFTTEDVLVIKNASEVYLVQSGPNVIITYRRRLIARLLFRSKSRP